MNRQFFFGIVLAAIFGATATLGAGQTGDAVLTGRVSEAGSGKPLAGIRVTNGSDVVLTGADGRYQLPRHPGLRTRFVSVVVPGNFCCETRYRPAAEGGGDFVLAPRPRRSGFTFIHVGDTETTKYDRHLNEIMAYARNTGAAFIIHTGDLSGKANKKQLAKDPENARWRTAIDFHADRLNAQHAGRPVYYTIGNHDMRGRYGESLWESRLGPVVYAFEEGDCLFVALPIAKGDVMPFDRPDDTAKFLKNLLATYPATQKVFLLSHSQTPLDCHGVFLKGSRYEVDLRQWDFLGMIHGHNHRSSVTPCGSRAAIWSTAMSSGGGRGNTPACFREFRVSADGKVSSELRYLYQERQLHGVVSPKPDADGRYPVAAVAYHTVMPVVKVVAERGGEKIELSRRSPMLWCGSFTTAGEAPLRTTATFADGSTLAAENATLRDGRLKLRRMIPLRQETRLGAPVTDGKRI
ncbi:MAG: metallophosphoesterase, partial [Lentisphaeria bacterium]|nr:metallophosphoesterase [Lentisphaeria bacterium]